jgi:hypothetical protein
MGRTSMPWDMSTVQTGVTMDSLAGGAFFVYNKVSVPVHAEQAGVGRGDHVPALEWPYRPHLYGMGHVHRADRDDQMPALDYKGAPRICQNLATALA